jgi:dipeptidyl-peptidase-4
LWWSLLPPAASLRAALGQSTDFAPDRIVPSRLRYEYGEFDGRPIYIASHFRELDAKLLQDCLAVITGGLRDLGSKVPAAAWGKLRRVPIWLEYEDAHSPQGRYWGSREWLVAHGYEPDKARGIQFTKTISLWHREQPMMLMHELAHAYHDQVLSFDDPAILAAYQRAKADGRYDKVKRNTGQVGPAYALRNHREFFAELTEAYFGENDYPPFTRQELQSFDPESYEVIAAAWARP